MSNDDGWLALRSETSSVLLLTAYLKLNSKPYLL